MTEQVTETTTTEEYEYLMKRYKRAIQDHRGTGNVVAELLNKLLDNIFSKNPNWSISRALTRIHNDSGDLGYSKNYLYNFLNEQNRQRLKESNRTKVSDFGNSSSSTFFNETPEQTYKRLVEEKAEAAEDAAKVRKNYNIPIEEEPAIEKGHENCLKRFTKLLEENEDLKEANKRLRENLLWFYNRSDIIFPLRLLQQYYDENNISPSAEDEVTIIQEKGRVVGVRAAQ